MARPRLSARRFAAVKLRCARVEQETPSVWLFALTQSTSTTFVATGFSVRLPRVIFGSARSSARPCSRQASIPPSSIETRPASPKYSSVKNSRPEVWIGPPLITMCESSLTPIISKIESATSGDGSCVESAPGAEIMYADDGIQREPGTCPAS